MDTEMKEPTSVDRDVLKQVVEEVMQETSRIDTEINNFTVNAEDFRAEAINDEMKITLSDVVVRNEMFTDVWARSLYAAFTDITGNSLPHFLVIEKCIIYILNSETLHFGVAKSLLSRLLFFHPPHSPSMETYYWHILTDSFLTLEFGGRENENLFFTVMKCLSVALENPVLIKDKEKQILGKRDYWSPEKDSTTALNYTVRLYYKHLPVSKQFDRAVLVFEFIYEILHKNFEYHRSRNTVHTAGDRCLLSRLLWTRVVDVGMVTYPLKRLLRLLVLMGTPSENHIGQTHKKFMTLLSEFYKYIDNDKNFNPFYKNKTNYLSSALSLKLYKALKNQFTTQGVKYLRMVRPHELRLIASCKWLGYVTCKFCPGEFTSVCEVLKLMKNLITKKRLYRGIYDVRNENRDSDSDDDQPESRLDMRYCSIDCEFIKRNKSKKMKLSVDDLKEPDCYGWAPLYKSIMLGHQRCVEKVVNFSGKPEPEEAFDEIIPGYKWFTPLICALIKEQAKVCGLLMDHSGHGLFEDINLNSDTPFDIFDDRDIGRIASSGGQGSSQPEMWKQFHFTPTDLPLVTEICTMLVESYFATHKIPDVLSRLRTYKARPSDSEEKKDEEAGELNEDLEESNTNKDTNTGEEPKESKDDLKESNTNKDKNTGEEPKESKNDLEESNTNKDANNDQEKEERNDDPEDNTNKDENNDEEKEEGNDDPEDNTNKDASTSEEPREWDYDRYAKDIDENLETLCRMLTQYAERYHIRRSLQPLHEFLHNFNED